MNPRYRRFLRVAIGVVAAWLLLAFALGPWLVRAAYFEELVGPFNSVIGGRDVHPVEFYLSAWRSFAIGATGVLALLLVGLGAWVRAPGARRDLIDRMLGATDGLGPMDFVKAAVAAGLLAGLAEASYAAVRDAVTHRPAANYHVEIWWMAPVSAAAAALLVGMAVALLAMGGRRRIGLRVALVVFGFMIVHSVMQSEGIPLHPAAELVLSLGLATVFARAVMRREQAAIRVIRHSGLAVAFGVAALAATAWTLRPASIEARILRSVSKVADGLPNVLIIIMDTARAANYSLYGYHRPTSPVLVDWGRSGVVFDRAVAPSPWTLPSHAGLFTGYQNQVLGLSLAKPLPESYTTLAEVLSEYGYHTAGFAANGAYTTSASGLAQGFARYEDRPWSLGYLVESSWLSRLVIAPGATRLHPAFQARPPHGNDITDGFLGWLEGRDRERPFMAFLNYMDVHEPYMMVPPDQASRFGPVPDEFWYDFMDRFYEEGQRDGLDEWVNRYDASIAYLDEQIGRIRTWLAEAEELDNTLVVISSDHGEMWGERDELGHAESVFAPVVHIPLLLSYPEAVPGGVRVDATVSLVDVPRTIFDLIPVEVPSDFGGASLVPLWTTADQVEPPPALAELWPGDEGTFRSGLLDLGPMKSLVDGQLQYIRLGDGSEFLFDIDLDYEESTNLALDPSHAQDLRRLRIALDSVAPRWQPVAHR